MADISALMASWFTPSSLFIFVNLVIGTIAITSRFGVPKRQVHEPEQLGPHNSPQLVRTPSLLDRVRSFNLGHYYTYQPAHAETEHAQPEQPEFETPCPNPENRQEPQLVRTPSLLQRLRSMSFSRLYRSESDTIHGVEEPVPEPDGPDSNPGHDSGERAQMRKSASESGGSRKYEWEEDEGAVERRRPAAARVETASLRGDEEVDAKADDFINRFKKQLRLQRMDSILRYREMLREN